MIGTIRFGAFWLAVVVSSSVACDGGQSGADTGGSLDGGAPPPGGGGADAGGQPVGNADAGTGPSAQGGIEILRRPPFRPRDPGMFSRVLYPEGPVEAPAAGPGRSEAQLRALLMEILGRRPALTASEVAATVALFDGQALKAVVAEPGLRAALLLLRGTAGDAAIANVMRGAFDAIGFGALPPFAEGSPALVEAQGGRARIVFAEWTRHDDPRALASVLAHETLHDDLRVLSKEEAICSAIEAIIAGQLALESPDIVRAGSRLSRSNNTRLLERLNSRDDSGRLRVAVSSGYTLPGSQAGFAFFFEFYEPFFSATAGGPALAPMVQAVTGQAAPTPTAFDNPMVEALDARQAALTPEQLVRLAGVLELDTNPAPDVPPPARPSTSPAFTRPPPGPGEAEAQRLLQQPPYAPRTIALFDQAAYPGGPPDAFASGPQLDAGAARLLLEQTLTRRLGASDGRVAATLALFDAGPLVAAVESPALRAALLLLRGTAADSVIEAFAAGVFTGLQFSEEIRELPFAFVRPPIPGRRPVLVVNGRLRFEDPRLLAPWIAGASLHEDATKTPKELLVGRALLPLLYGQLLLESPALARSGTWLTRILNRELLARLNSRDAEGRLRLLSGRGPIYPRGAGTQESFLALFTPYGPDTPGNRTLWDIVAAVTGDPSFQGPFSIATVRLMDERQALFTAEQLVALARALDLELPASP